MTGPLLLPWEGMSPCVDDGYIAPNATLIGQVEIGPGSGVFFGAVLRADRSPIRIGRDSNVQDNAAIHTSEGASVVIGDETSIGHNAVVHGAMIGSRSLVGMGAVVLNHARVGEGCLVAAGAVVREGSEIPDGVLAAGVPARVLRPLTEAERERILSGARIYRDLIWRYKDQQVT